MNLFLPLIDELKQSDLYFKIQQTLKIKYVQIAAGIVGVLTLRKILDIVRRKWKRLPPGPVGLPFFGTIYEFGNLNSMMHARKKYGPIYLTHFGFSSVCFINDYALLNKYFSQIDFCDRFDTAIGYECPFTGIPNDKEWQQRRKLMTHNMISPLNSKIIT